jgi:hypothetical protein
VGIKERDDVSEMKKRNPQWEFKAVRW